MVCYGVSETVFGEWSVMGGTIILVHSYYNVWLRAQLGWQSFLLRRDAVNKIKSLPTASPAQLRRYNDICAICYQVAHPASCSPRRRVRSIDTYPLDLLPQDLSSAVITPCSHFFHAGCLKKWLYVQETCPLCHAQLKSQSAADATPTNRAPAGQGEVGEEKPTEGGAAAPSSSRADRRSPSDVLDTPPSSPVPHPEGGDEAGGGATATPGIPSDDPGSSRRISETRDAVRGDVVGM